MSQDASSPDPTSSPEPARFEEASPSKAKKPRVWTLLLVLSAWFCGSLLSAFILGVAAVVRVTVDTQERLSIPDTTSRSEVLLSSPEWVAPAAVFSVCISLGLAVLGALLSPVRPVMARLSAGPSRCSATQLVWISVGALALSTVLGCAAELVGWRSLPLEQLTQLAQAPLPVFLVALVAIVGAGPAEEALCRGYLQTRLQERWGPRVAVLVSAVCFGALHFDPLHSTIAFVLGLYLGVLAIASGSIRPGILAHAFNNLVGFLLSRFFPGWDSSYVAMSLSGGVALAVFCVAMWKLRPLLSSVGAAPDDARDAVPALSAR
jgi:membrane protease YdiL (CAAX protease family)